MSDATIPPVIVTLPNGARVELHHDIDGRRMHGLVLRGPGADEAARALRSATTGRPRPVHVGRERRLIRSLDFMIYRDAPDEIAVKMVTIPWAPSTRPVLNRGLS